MCVISIDFVLFYKISLYFKKEEETQRNKETKIIYPWMYQTIENENDKNVNEKELTLKYKI